VTLREERPGVWRGDIWHQGRRIKLTFKGASKEAKEYEARRRLEITRAGIVKSRDVLTFAVFVADKYEPAAKLELSTGTWRVRPYQLKPLRHYFGPMKITKITEQHVEAYKHLRARLVSKATVNSELNVLSAIFSYARDMKIPCASPKIRRFKVRTNKGNAKAYTRAEVGFILAAAGLVAPRFLPLVKFLFETGARKSEAINLPWSRVDLERGLAFIWNEIDDDEADSKPDDESDYAVKSVEREVTLSDGLLELLREQKATVGSSEWVFPVAMNRMHTKGDKYWEFPDATWGRVLARANELAKSVEPSARKIAGGPHRCRHTFASHFLRMKPDLFALGRVLGHSHTRVTELYSHLLADHLAGTRNIVTFEAALIDVDATPATTPASPIPVAPVSSSNAEGRTGRRVTARRGGTAAVAARHSTPGTTPGVGSRPDRRRNPE
jgi:integrase